MDIGSIVAYVPGVEHALQRNQVNGPHGPAGAYPWVIGRVKGKDTLELADKEAEKFLEFVRRSPDVKVAMRQVTFIRPKHTWPGTVTAINDDGTVDLDVQSNMGGVTLHLTGVVVNAGDINVPHSCAEVE
jgi:hypothetical protein